MSKKNRERRAGEGGAEPTSGGGGGGGGGAAGLNWLPIVLAVAALVLGFVAWTDGKRIKDDTARRLVDIDQRLIQLQTQVASAAKAAGRAAGSRPNRSIRWGRRSDQGKPTADVIAEFSDYQ
jgi:hypothetical protein